MSKLRKPPPKTIGNKVIERVEDTLATLYRRMCHHIDFEFTEQMAYETLVRPEDVKIVKRASELYRRFRSYYFAGGAARMLVGEYEIRIEFDPKLCFMPPNYLVTGPRLLDGNHTDFCRAIAPWMEQIVPIYEMHSTTLYAWRELCELTGGDYARIRVLWPTIDVIATTAGYTVPKMGNPRGLPATSPSLRERLNIGQTFVNSAMMMPEPDKRARPIELFIE